MASLSRRYLASVLNIEVLRKTGSAMPHSPSCALFFLALRVFFKEELSLSLSSESPSHHGDAEASPDAIC